MNALNVVTLLGWGGGGKCCSSKGWNSEYFK